MAIASSTPAAIGDKEANKHASKRKDGTQGGADKVTISGLLERGGEIRVRTISRPGRSVNRFKRTSSLAQA